MVEKWWYSELAELVVDAAEIQEVPDLQWHLIKAFDGDWHFDGSAVKIC